jgi:hypothetical protein
MIDPLTIGIGAAIWFAFKKQTRTHFGVLTPERKEVYANALEFLQDPLRLNKMADEFQGEGLKIEALMLRKRAEWRSRTPEQCKAHDEIFRKGMASTNVHGILEVAKAFESLTATIKAQMLRKHAAEVQLANEAAAQSVMSEVAERDGDLTDKMPPKGRVIEVKDIGPKGVRIENPEAEDEPRTTVIPRNTNGKTELSQ